MTEILSCRNQYIDLFSIFYLIGTSVIKELCWLATHEASHMQSFLYCNKTLYKSKIIYMINVRDPTDSTDVFWTEILTSLFSSFSTANTGLHLWLEAFAVYAAKYSPFFLRAPETLSLMRWISPIKLLKSWQL